MMRRMAKLILGITGEMASGKTFSTKYLAEKYEAESFRFSTPLREVLARLYIKETRENIAKITLFLLKEFGDDLLSQIIAKDAANAKTDLVVIDGIRRLPDIAALEKLPEFKLVYLEVDPEIRYQRLSVRGENADDTGKTWDQFQKDQMLGTETQIRSLKDHAAVVINNNGSPEEL
jgi:dephospho-CoA kinase